MASNNNSKGTSDNDAVYIAIQNLGNDPTSTTELASPTDRFLFPFDAKGQTALEIDTSELSNVLREAIQTATKYKRALVISHFAVFTGPKGLHLLKILANSKLPLSFEDQPAMNSVTLPGAIILRESTDDQRQKNKAVDKRKENSGRHLLSDLNQRKKVRRKLQRFFYNFNNNAALRHLLREAQPGVTLNELALSLYDEKIPTATGKGHTPKSVSRLKEKIKDLEILFEGESPKDMLEQLMRINRQHYNISPILAREVYGVMGSAMEQAPKALENTWEEKMSTGLAAPREDKDQVPKEAMKRKAANTGLVPVDIANNTNFTDIIRLSFTSPVEDLKLSIYPPFGDYDKELDSFHHNYPGQCRKVEIVIDQDTYLLPGRYYLFLTATGYEPTCKVIMIHGELAPNQ